jgi:hypothetical protein
MPYVLRGTLNGMRRRRSEGCRRASAIVCGIAISFLATSCSPRQASPSVDMQKSCRDFVVSFYSWYVPKALEEGGIPASELALTEKGSVFSTGLLEALREDFRAQAKAEREIVGLDFDPFLYSQDPSPRYVVGNLTTAENNCWAEVHGVSSSNSPSRPDLVPELTFNDGRWLFVNFHYGRSERSDDENLIDILKRLQHDREQNPQ